MDWSIGFDDNWNRDIGYGVPAYCDHPDCNKRIDRGLGYVCGGEPYGGKLGCGLFFCAKHMKMGAEVQQCEQCIEGKAPFNSKPDHPDWIKFKAKDPSWERWRKENPGK